jgi:hypothetical protein
MTAWVVVMMEGFIVGELVLPAFVFLMEGMLHPATRTKLTRMKIMRSTAIFTGI